MVRQYLQKRSHQHWWYRLIKYHLLISLVALGIFFFIKPQQFIDLWLTPDQQGQILFSSGHYQQASQRFSDIQWQAFSAYAAEDFRKSVILYGQFNTRDSKFAQANALAHQRNYLKARDLYQSILAVEPDDHAATTNITIVQLLIDEINLLSASQQAEQGEASTELGDNDPRTADGVDREILTQQELEQLSSEQLLLAPALNEMWLRQVQKDPARFLAQKFYMQLEGKKTKNPSQIINDSIKQ